MKSGNANLTDYRLETSTKFILIVINDEFEWILCNHFTIWTLGKTHDNVKVVFRKKLGRFVKKGYMHIRPKLRRF